MGSSTADTIILTLSSCTLYSSTYTMAVVSMSSAPARRVVKCEATETKAAPAEAPVAPPPAPKPETFGDMMNFGGYLPEINNGRLAMLGFIAGAPAEIATQQPIAQQWAEHPFAVVAHIVIFSLASVMPRVQGEKTAKPESTEFGVWKASSELLNGRAAMIGMASLLIIESITGKAFF